MNDTKTPGDKIASFGAILGALLASMWKAFMLAAVALGAMLMDLLLGPNLMTDFAQQQGVNTMPSITMLICGFFSISTSGFQYLLIAKLRYDKGSGGFRGASAYDKIVLLICYAVIIADTLNDLGGMTALMYGPEVGSKIFPDNWMHNPIWITSAIFTVLVCGLNEAVLTPLLKLEVERRTQTMRARGSAIIDFTLESLDTILGSVHGAVLIVSRLTIFALDLALSAHFVSAKASSSDITHNRNLFIIWMPIIVSLTITAVLFLLFLKLHPLVSQAAGIKEFLILLKVNRKYTIPTVFLMALDGYLDWGGVTALLYGPDAGAIPPNASRAWLLTEVLCFLICACHEWLMDGVLSPMYERKAKGERKPKKPKPPKVPKTKKGSPTTPEEPSVLDDNEPPEAPQMPIFAVPGNGPARDGFPPSEGAPPDPDPDPFAAFKL